MDKREKLFIFDIGGVFVKLDPASRDLAISRGGSARSASRYAEAPEALFRAFRLGHSAEADYVRALSDVFDVPQESVYEAEHAYVAEGFSGFIDFVRRLRQSYRVVCLSNNQAIHWRYISENILGEGFFDHAYLSQDMGLEKPDEMIFRHVFEAERCDEKEVFFIDDIEENVIAARQVGWQHCMVHRDPVETANALSALAGDLAAN
ncbi:HAD-IA family hydrolase [Rhizobium terrae]|uniref:HAD-IA family hydrolase n=1 Tax=Rhizobium terrae TaxID=2171756 RepID=UPI000E3C876A|nr:HAD-IA family hydrolase [Rhizobium terrae]